MKKTLLLCSALALFMAGLASCKQTGAAAGAGADSLARTSVEGEIVFIRVDSLMANFEMYKELSTSFEARSTKADADLTARGNAFERKAMKFQEDVQKGLLTTRMAQEQQAGLEREQQNLMTFRDNLMNELAEEEGVMMRRINNCIELYMKEFNAGDRFKMVLSTAGGTPVLVADPSLDVTTEAIAGLNAYYTANRDSL